MNSMLPILFCHTPYTLWVSLRDESISHAQSHLVFDRMGIVSKGTWDKQNMLP